PFEERDGKMHPLAEPVILGARSEGMLVPLPEELGVVGSNRVDGGPFYLKLSGQAIDQQDGVSYQVRYAITSLATAAGTTRIDDLTVSFALFGPLDKLPNRGQRARLSAKLGDAKGDYADVQPLSAPFVFPFAKMKVEKFA